jgi:predicted hydrocarbon binding protein
MDLIGNIGEGRPNLGSTIDIALYRLMQFSIRDVLLRKFSPEIAARVFFEAGEMTGRELCKALIKKTTDFETFIRETQEVLANLKIGMLEMEKVDLENMCFTLTVSEDLDCSGMPASNETICTYDEGFLSGLLSQYTGTRFHAREISCWCSGDRLCRFELKPAA